MVRRVLAKYYHPDGDGNGPSWLTFLGHMKDSLWSVDLFRCESITLKSHWVLVVTVPDVPVSHPFVERLIGTIRREFLDHILFWNAVDLERKLGEFRVYYNNERVHASLGGDTPAEVAGELKTQRAKIDNFQWHSHCRGLVQLPIAA
ncbi:MAG: transposase [Gammaproteobacteria bacterium]|nr:transposase [Gammaproteobacteria bacterium]MDH3380234.1 transposase [Gammaproteobacteria bacterium]